MNKYIMISTTFDNENEMYDIMDYLLDEHLISCYQVSNIKSSYHWKGNIESENEFLVNMKTKISLYKEIEKIIISKHSYEVPQIVFCKIDGNREYLDWIDKETK